MTSNVQVRAPRTFSQQILRVDMMMSMELFLSYSFKNDFDIQSTMKKILNLTGSSIDGSVTVKPTINPVLFIMLAINGLLIGSLGPIGTRLSRSQRYEVKR